MYVIYFFNLTVYVSKTKCVCGLRGLTKDNKEQTCKNTVIRSRMIPLTHLKHIFNENFKSDA